jgi:hypothetical protein
MAAISSGRGAKDARAVSTCEASTFIDEIGQAGGSGRSGTAMAMAMVMLLM